MWIFFDGRNEKSVFEEGLKLENFKVINTEQFQY